MVHIGVDLFFLAQADSFACVLAEKTSPIPNLAAFHRLTRMPFSQREKDVLKEASDSFVEDVVAVRWRKHHSGQLQDWEWGGVYNYKTVSD